MDAYTHAAIEGALTAPLNAGQIRLLAIEARSAYAVALKSGFTHASEKFDDWRHREQFAAVGVASLKAARQRHFRPLLAHWQDLRGRPMQAMASRRRAALEPAAQARAVLERECAKAAAAGVFADARAALGYCAGFLRNKRDVEIGTAQPRDLWHAVFMIRRRCGQVRGRARGGVIAFPNLDAGELAHGR